MWANSRHDLTALCAARRRRRLIMVRAPSIAQPCVTEPRPAGLAPRQPPPRPGSVTQAPARVLAQREALPRSG